MIKKNKIIKCTCGSEAIIFDVDEDLDLIYVSIWQDGCHKNNKLSFKERIRWIWKLITTGTPFYDQMVLDIKSIEDIQEVLKELKKDISKRDE
jgi:hypothetical protein